ncbi:MAG TPA: porin [Vicinamibacteria bacterium]
MKRTLVTLGLLAALVASQARAAEVVGNEKFTLNANGRLQWLAVGQKLDDPFRNDDRLYLFMKQARLGLNGKYQDVKFDLQLAYGGEELVAASPGVGLGLLDFSFDVPTPLKARVKVGQFRVPYGRERLTDSGTLNFGDRSIQSLGFSWNRDVGAALHTYRGRFAGTVGVFTGGGRDVPQRYLPEKLGSPMFVTRFGYNDGIDEDVFTVHSREERPDRTKVAVYANALYMKDSLIGHSTVLNVRSTDKSLLLNPNWNPFVAQTPFVQGRVWQAGGDAVVRAPLGPYAMTAEAEVNYGKFSNTYGTVVLKGGRLQVGVAKGAWDASVRHAVLYPDARMANTYTPTGGTPQHSNLFADDKPMREFTPSLTYHYRANVALVGDLPILVNTLVFKENKLGTYVGIEHPDQATVVKPGAGFATRQNVYEARLMIQLTF